MWSPRRSWRHLLCTPADLAAYAVAVAPPVPLGEAVVSYTSSHTACPR